jgi:hypothetical protein
MGTAASKKPRDEELENPILEEQEHSDIDIENGSPPAPPPPSRSASRSSSSSSSSSSSCCCPCRSKSSPYKKLKDQDDHDSKGSDKIVHSSFKRLVSLARPESCRLTIATVFLFIGTGCSLLQPLYFGKILDIASGDDHTNQVERVNRVAIQLLVLLFVGAITSAIRLEDFKCQ